MNEELLRYTKLVSLLATCHTAADKIFVSMIKQHEPQKVVCAKYNYDIYFSLKKRNDHFVVDSTHDTFLDLSDAAAEFVLDGLNTLSDWQKSQLTALKTPLNLINIYEKTYKYLFIQCTVDYNIDHGLVHQCGILVDLAAGQFLFYEPYGVYNKYSADYAKCIGDYLQQYAAFLPVRFLDTATGAPNIAQTAGKTVKYATFHAYFGLNEGIQTIILQKNNARGDDYDAKLAAALAKLKLTNADLAAQIVRKMEQNNNPVNATDRSVKLLDVLAILARNVSKDVNQDDFMAISYEFNSKSCVSITIVEMNHFFGLDLPDDKSLDDKSLEDKSRIDKSPLMRDFYQQFRDSTVPSAVLVANMRDFIKKLPNSAHIAAAIDSIAPCPEFAKL